MKSQKRKKEVEMYKKSQAALEFLTTYLWAFLVILIAIGALAYFGILSPSKFLPKRCSISPEIGCIDAIIGQTNAGTGVLMLKLKNNLAQPIVVTSWDTSSESQIPFSCLLGPTSETLLSNEIKDFEFTNCNNADAGIVLGEKAKVNVKMEYYSVLSSIDYSKKVEGEILATVTTVEGILTQPECSDGTDNDNNGCIDYGGGDTGCSSPLDITESGGTCPQSGGGGQSLNCFVSTVCSTTIVFKINNLNDAHAELPSLSNYDYKVCCNSATDTLSNSCASPDAIPLHLSSTTDAHVEKNTQANFNVNVCLSAVTGTVSCSYTTGTCAADETCLATISSDTDANVGDCVTQPFANKICCKIL